MANKSVANTFGDYLKEKEQDINFETFDFVRLNEVLCHFLFRHMNQG